ncbi:MAG: hypothetical protein V1913_15870 [Fibrobacterota bacterium]
MVTAKVQAGICGFVSDITADSDDGQNVTFKITSNCDKITRLAAILPVVDAYAEIGDGYDGQVYQPFRKGSSGCCAGCAVAVGLFKAMQVAAHLALPQEVHITIMKSE